MRRRGEVAKMARRRSYQRVLLAVYWLADEEGLLCVATNAEFCAETRLSLETMRRYLDELEERGLIQVVRDSSRKPCRTLVLMDHPGAWDYLDNLAGRISADQLPLTDCPGIARKDTSRTR